MTERQRRATRQQRGSSRQEDGVRTDGGTQESVDMGDKRRVLSRHKAEPPAKRRTPTPAKEASHVEPHASKGDGLPFKIRPDQPLPTIEQPQRLDLFPQEYQSVPRSGVLAASLQRSRQKWISEGVFERYWTKPSRKKNQLETPNNPSRDTMLKVGTCKLTIEPHVFEVTLFTIKEPYTAAPMEQPIQKPVQQYGQANNVHAPPQAVPGASAQIPSSHQPLPRTTSHPPTAYAQTSSNDQPQGWQSNRHPSYQLPTPTSSLVEPRSTNPPLPNTNPVTPGPPREPLKPTQDPVIQMLATRASSNASLKALMKVVASGNASHDQLKVFQSHIDELTALLSKQASSTAPSPAPSPAPRPPPPAASPYSTQAPTSNGSSYHEPRNAAGASHPTSNYAFKASYTQSSYPQPAPSTVTRPQPPPRRPDISGIALEFTSGSGDRFLFPTYSILEYLPGNRQVIASFLIVRRGSASSHYSPDKEYYQPVTVRFTTDFPKVLEPLARVVKPQEEVRKWMNDVMDRCTRAEYVHLAIRLPKPEGAGNDEEDVNVEVRSREESTSTSFTPAGSVVPERRRTSKTIKAT